MTDTDVAALINGAVPFLTTAGITIVDAAPGLGVATVEPLDRTANHLGGTHAAVIFGAGEAASGAAVIAALGERFLEVVAVVRDADIRFVKRARGALTATASHEYSDADAVLAARDVEVKVQVADETGTEVATGAVRWAVRPV